MSSVNVLDEWQSSQGDIFVIFGTNIKVTDIGQIKYNLVIIFSQRTII